MIGFQEIEQARERIRDQIMMTPVLESQRLNEWLGHRILFKAECFQRVGAFKARGALNAVRALESSPSRIVSYSSGNHAQAIAWAAQLEGYPASVFMSNEVSPIKARCTRSYGAEVLLRGDRPAAEAEARKLLEQGGVLIPPFDHDDVIAGQGTIALELRDQLKESLDFVFAPIGGGGLCSGLQVGLQKWFPEATLCGAEPLAGNDAAQSFRAGRVVALGASPQTLADGARTLSVSERTFSYLQKLEGIFEVSEREIVYWTQWLTHLLKVTIEPTASLGMAAAVARLSSEKKGRTAVVVLTGGNMDLETRKKVWEEDRLMTLPRLDSLH